MGIFAAAQATETIWPSAALDSTSGSQAGHGPLAIGTFLALMVPGIIVGFAGAFFTIVVPLFYYTGERIAFGKQGRRDFDIAILRWYGDQITALLAREPADPNPRPPSTHS
jgi:hypothetical protein